MQRNQQLAGAPVLLRMVLIHAFMVYHAIQKGSGSGGKVQNANYCCGTF